ncbi:unnamed protein product [Schistosoma bovis]|nr:unnamed protein product [Schistosoma bovis]
MHNKFHLSTYSRLLVCIRSQYTIFLTRNCVNGHCINGTCVCNTCWIGKTCEERVHRIPKFTQTVFTFETKFSNWINGSLIGSLSLSDENSSLASCGSVQFNIVVGSNYLPVAIDGTTGILKVIESDYETMKNNHTITFQVTVRNANTSLNISDDATVNILFDEEYSDEERGSEITAVKRGVIVPPNTINVTFSRVYIQDNPNYCLFDTWFIDSVIVLTPGNNSLIMKFSGPSLNNVYYGYIQYLFAYYNGSNIANDYPVKFSNLTYLNNNSSSSEFTMTSQISVSSAPANDSNDFSIRMRFQVGLFPQMSIPPIGTNLTVRMEALLTPKITVDIPMRVSSHCPIQYDSVNFTKCPPQVEVGGVYEYSVDYFISRPIGDYVFTFTTDEFSASIGHISLTLPTTFSTYPEGYKIDTQQFVGYNFVLTTIGYVSVSNLQNPGVYDTTLPMMNRSVRLTVFIQIYRPSLVSVKFEAKISPLGKNSTVNFCESQLIAFAGPNLAAKSNLTSKDTSVVNQAEKLQFFNLQLSILPSTTARYSIYITNTGKLNTEQCSVDYLLTENNSTKKIRLITEYTVFQGRRTTGTTTIGIFRNNNPWNVFYNFQIGVKLLYDTTYVLGDTIQTYVQMFSGSSTVCSFVVTLPIASMEKPTPTTPVSKTPVVTIEKVEPRNSQPTVNFSTIVEVRVKFVEDFVYMPITFQLQVNSNEAIIIRQSIQTIGYLLKTVAPVNYYSSVKPNLARLQINSVYFNESCTDAQCDIAMRYSIIPITTKPLIITSTFTSGVSSFTKTLTITPRDNYSTVLSSSQVLGVDLISIDSKTIKNQVIPNYMTSLKLTLTLKPNVWQSIYFQLYAPGAYQEYILVKPIMLSQSTSLPYVSSVSDSLENMVYISIDKAYYEGIATDQTISAVNQLTYYIPMFTANSVRPLVNFTYNLTVNSISIFGNFIFTTTTPAAFTTTFISTWTLNYPSATDVYKQMCTGGPFEFILTMCPVERRCSFFTYWINRIVNGIAALNVTKVAVYKLFSDVRLSTSFSLNLTSERSYVRVDYGPSCLINQDYYCTQFKHTLYVTGDCNVTTTINYAFPTFVNISGSTKNFTGQTLVLSPIPSFPIYTDIMIEVSPSSVTLQPGQITTINVKYIFPLNSTYLKSTIQISGTGSNNTNESIITITDFRINLGSNLFYTTTAYSSNYLSTYPTDQNDQLLIYFENITNIGTVSVPLMRNTLSLSVDIRLSDSKIVENGTVWPLQITGRFNAVTNISKISVYCVRTGSEKPSIHVVLSQLSSFTFSDYPDRDVVYLQTTVQMMNGTGLECERQSIIFYLSPEIKSIIVVNQTGNIDNVTLKTPLNPVSKSVQFIAGRLYFGAKYEVIFSLKFNPSLSTTIVKYPVLVEIVCKPYERGSPVVNSCAKQRFYKFKSHLRVQLDYTYPPNLPHYVAMRNPLVQLPDRQANTFLNVGDLLFYCARAFSMKGSLDLVRRCFKIGKLPERIWFDVGPYVEQIIAYTNPLGILFGLGANGGGVMMSKDLGKTWISINSFMYQRTLNTSTEIITASVIPWISFTGSIDNTLSKSFCKMRVAKQWDVCINAIYANELLLADWTNTCPNIKPF